MRDRTPCTLFTAGPDDDGRDILNIRWVNPWGGLYGRSGTRVIAVRKAKHMGGCGTTLHTPDSSELLQKERLYHFKGGLLLYSG